LCVSVKGRYIKVIDATVEGFRDKVVRPRLLHVHDHNATQAYDGEALAGLPERALGYGCELPRFSRTRP
jgi:hypothetical protein